MPSAADWCRRRARDLQALWRQEPLIATAADAQLSPQAIAERVVTQSGWTAGGTLEEHLHRPRLSRLSPATQASGPVEDEWLRDNLVAIAQLAESLDRSSFDLAMRIVPFEWWAAQLPDRPSTVENQGT